MKREKALEVSNLLYNLEGLKEFKENLVIMLDDESNEAVPLETIDKLFNVIDNDIKELKEKLEQL